MGEGDGTSFPLPSPVVDFVRSRPTGAGDHRRRGQHAEQYTTFGQDGPMGRPAQPAELAPSYVFLASDEARYITGEILGVTGGQPPG